MELKTGSEGPCSATGVDDRVVSMSYAAVSLRNKEPTATTIWRVRVKFSRARTPGVKYLVTSVCEWGGNKPGERRKMKLELRSYFKSSLGTSAVSTRKEEYGCHKSHRNIDKKGNLWLLGRSDKAQLALSKNRCLFLMFFLLSGSFSYFTSVPSA